MLGLVGRLAAMGVAGVVGVVALAQKAFGLVAPKKAQSSAALFNLICLASIEFIHATILLLPDPQHQLHSGYWPYNGDYLIDLKQQLYEYGKQLHGHRFSNAEPKGATATPAEPVDDNIDPRDNIALYGGLAVDGRPAELVRVKKDGTAISLATGRRVNRKLTPLTVQRFPGDQVLDQDEIRRSMARRKKNASPEDLAPKRCTYAGCTKQFKRNCDLTKHIKTHLRPWKCPDEMCKFHTIGWPTEKERDRHFNDRHADTPTLFPCKYRELGCNYQSKRESNLNQHMEKAHGLPYCRSKSNGKKRRDSAVSPVSGPVDSYPWTPQSQPSSQSAFEHMAQQLPVGPANGIQPDALDGTPFLGYPSPLDSSQSFDQPSPLDSMQSFNQSNSVPGMQLEAFDGTQSMDQLGTVMDSMEPFAPYQDGPDFVINDDIYAAQARLQPQPLVEAQPPQPQPRPHPQLMLRLQGQYQLQYQLGAQLPQVSPRSSLSDDEALMAIGEYATSASGSAITQDWTLFSGNAGQSNDHQLLDGVPRAALGFSQPSELDMFQRMDWAGSLLGLGH